MLCLGRAAYCGGGPPPRGGASDEAPDDLDATPGLTDEQQQRLNEIEAAYDRVLGPPPELPPDVQRELEAIWSKGAENLTAADEAHIAELLGPIPELTREQEKQLEALDAEYDKILGNSESDSVR